DVRRGCRCGFVRGCGCCRDVATELSPEPGPVGRDNQSGEVGGNGVGEPEEFATEEVVVRGAGRVSAAAAALLQGDHGISEDREDSSGLELEGEEGLVASDPFLWDDDLDGPTQAVVE